MTRQRIRIAISIVAVVSGCNAIVGCGGQSATPDVGPESDPPTSAASSATRPSASVTPAVSPTPTANQQAAIDAVTRYIDYESAVDSNPASFDFTAAQKVALGDSLDGLQGSANFLQENHRHYAGTPAVRHLFFIADISKDSNHQEFKIGNCPGIGADWGVYDDTTKQRIPDVTPQSSSAPRPWLVTFRVGHAHDGWIVGQVDADRTKTCSAP